MPTRNVVKNYAVDSYYHLYTRGVDKQTIFRDSNDKTLFLGLLKRYLSSEQTKRKKHAPYASYVGKVDLLAYCLMGNHVHLLFYQHGDVYAISELMRRILTTYSMYFNKKYMRVGPLFQSKYLASHIDNDAYLYHISRYIHRNPRRWDTYDYSSLKYFTGRAEADWVKPGMILELFDDNVDTYLDFVRQMDEADLDEVAYEYLAHS